MDYLTNTEELTAIADAIREKTGSNGLISFPTGFVNEIESIEAGDVPSGEGVRW